MNAIFISFIVMYCSIEFEDEEKRTPILLAASLNKFKQLDIMLKVYTSKYIYIYIY